MTQLTLAKKLTDMAELEQLRAERANDEAHSAQNLGQQVQALARKDRHTARAGAFVEAARAAMETR